MKKRTLISLVLTVFLLLTSIPVLAETDAERLDRLEREIKEIKAMKPSRRQRDFVGKCLRNPPSKSNPLEASANHKNQYKFLFDNR